MGTPIATNLAITRFGVNEDCINTFVNTNTPYTTNTSPSQSVQSLPSFIAAAQTSINSAVLSLATPNIRGVWAASTTYAIKDVVSVTVSSIVTWYVCIVAHTSSAAFTTDSSSKWSIYQGVTTATLLANGSLLIGYTSPDGSGTSTVFNRLSLLDGVSPATTATDGNPVSSVNSFRNASGVSGGTSGYVNPGIWHHTITGANETSYEWGMVSVMDNYSNTLAQNVAIYGQGNKYTSAGATWGGVFEAHDQSGSTNPTGGLVGIEVDNWGNGTDGNNVRVGVDVSIGKSDPSGSIMETGFGVRVGALNSDLTQGRVIRAFSTGAITFDCAFDSSLGTQSTAGVAYRMANGHKLSFTSTNDRTLSYTSSGLTYNTNSGSVFTVSDTGNVNQTGQLSILGLNVLTSRRTGYTNAMTGTADRSTPLDTSSVTLVQLAQRLKAIEDDLLTHGLIGS